MPSESDQAAPTSSIQERQPVATRQRQRREPHTKIYVSNARSGTLDQSHTYTATDSQHVPLRSTPEVPSRLQSHTMRIPFTENEEIRLDIPQGARVRGGSRGDAEFGGEQTPFSGPVRTHRNSSRGEQSQRGDFNRHEVLATSVHNASSYQFPTSNAPSHRPQVQQSAQTSPYDMQARTHQQQRQGLGGSGHAMHQASSSHPGDIHRNAQHNMTIPFQDAHAFQAQPVQAIADAQSITDMRHNVNQQPGYPSPRYATNRHHNQGPDQQQQQAQAPYDTRHISHHPSESWSQPEHRTDEAEAAQAHPMRQLSQQWQPQTLTSNPMQPMYAPQQTSSAGPVRHVQQQFHSHQRAHSLVSQPYPRPNDGGQSRAVPLVGVHSRHASMPTQGRSSHDLTSSPGGTFAQSPTVLSLGGSPRGLSYSGQPADQGPQAMSYNPMLRQYTTMFQGQTQSPTQYSQSPTSASMGVPSPLRRQSSLGLPPGLQRFGSPESSGDQALPPPPPADLDTTTVQGGSLRHDSDYQTSVSGFQAAHPPFGAQMDTGSSNSPYFTHGGRAVQTSASESPGVSQAVEPTYSGRREKRKDPRPHKCQECGKGFPRPSALVTHMSVHSGDKPYNCPVVSCNKSFAVRSNARRHLKTHGIKLKTRDRGSKSAAPQASADQHGETSGDEGENDDETDDDDEMEPSTASTSQKRLSTISVNALAKPPDRGLGIALHRGHANPHSNVHADPFGLGTSLSLIKGERAGTILERVKRGRSGDKRNRWEMEMSGRVKLRTARKGVATSRSRRGLRSDDVVSKAGASAEGEETLQEDDGEGETVHELEEDALLRLCPEREEPATQQMPQLDKADLDKLIAPPLAWDGFQKQKMLQESGQDLTLDQRLAFHAGAGGSADLLRLSGVPIAQQEGQNTNANSASVAVPSAIESPTNPSSSTVRCTQSSQGDSLVVPEQLQVSAPPVIRPMSASNRGGAGSTANFLPWSLSGGGSSIDPRPQLSSFLTSSVRTSAAPAGPVAFVPHVPAREASHNIIGLSALNHTTPPPTFQSGIGDFSPPSPGSGSSEGAIGSYREDGTWTPASMNAYVNVERLRNSEPFDDLGLPYVELQIPLPAVQPRHMHSTGGGRKHEERNSYSPNIGLYPYHPSHFNWRPILAGPAPPSPDASITPWRSAIAT